MEHQMVIDLSIVNPTPKCNTQTDKLIDQTLENKFTDPKVLDK